MLARRDRFSDFTAWKLAGAIHFLQMINWKIFILSVRKIGNSAKAQNIINYTDKYISFKISVDSWFMAFTSRSFDKWKEKSNVRKECGTMQ